MKGKAGVIGLLLLLIRLPLEANDIDDLQKELAALTARVETLERQVKGEHGESIEVGGEAESITLSSLAEAGKVKFNTYCTACHKNEFTDPMLAPPMATVLDHYGQVFGNDKAAFVDAVVNWVKAPSNEKTLMPGAIRNFNLMPPFILPDADLTEIATYLFEADIPQPTGFEQHLEAERRQLGQGGPGFGQGRQGQGGQGFGRGRPGQGFGQGGQGFGSGQSQDAAEQPQTSQSSISVSELAVEGKNKFEMYCMACHKYDQVEPMLAPPIFAVADHYKQNYGDDQQAFVAAIINWAKAPSEEKSLMPGAISRFQMMPPFPIPDPDLKAVATFMFETDFTIPNWYDEHYLAEHGEARPEAATTK